MTHTFPTRLSYELADPDLDRMRLLWGQPRPVAAIVFYRAQMQAGDVAPVAALASALTEAGLNPLPVFVTSLKDRSEEHTSELQSLMRISYDVFCLITQIHHQIHSCDNLTDL